MKRIVSILFVSLLAVGLGAGTWLLSSLPDMDFDDGGATSARTSPTTTLAELDAQRSKAAADGPLARGGWIPLDSGPVAAPRLTVEREAANRWRIELEISGFHMAARQVAGRRTSVVSLPGQEMLRRAGLPEVPVMTLNLPVPAGAGIRVEILEHLTSQIASDPVIPSVGHVERLRDPSLVPVVFGDFYAQGGVWPPYPYVVGTPFRLRDLEGVNLRLQPLRYDSDQGVVVASRRLVLEITATGASATKAVPITPDDAFAPIYDFAFQSVAPAAAEKYNPLPTRGRMLIVTDPAFAGDVAALAAWKLRLGIEAEVITTDETGSTPQQISAVLQERYDSDAGLTWVVLVGDRAQIPPHVGAYDGSDSDSRYALLAGDDLYPDVYVSRLSASTRTQVQTQVARILAYEQYTLAGDGDWLRGAVGIASDEGVPTDYERLELLRADLLDFGFDPVERQYQGLGGTRDGIRAAVEAGCSLINYLGHGTGTSWLSVPFDLSDVRGLAGGAGWPWIVDVSCSNGDFELDPCFAEAWMQAGTPTDPRGAVAVISATSDTPWVPPTVMQTEIVDLLTGGEVTMLGSLYFGGLMKVLDLYAGLPVATRVFEQNVVFGDGSMQVRTAAPGTFDIAEAAVLQAGAASWSLSVTARDGLVEGARVVLSGDGVLYGMGTAQTDGSVTLTLQKAPPSGQVLDVTVSGFDMIPYLGEVTVGTAQIAPVHTETLPGQDETVPAAVHLLGNYPNPFNPTTRISFDLPRTMHVQLDVFDIRGRRVARLLDETVSAGRSEVAWTAQDDAGRSIASGVYLYRLTTEDGALNGRMTLSK